MLVAGSSSFPLWGSLSGAELVLGAAPRRALVFRMNKVGTEEIPDLEDVRLVRGMTAGNAASLGEFYDKWSAKVYSIAISIVGEAADAEEVVEEAFLQAWNQAARFDTARGRPASWILNIARSRSLDRLKAVKRRREDLTDSFDASASSDLPDPAEQLVEKERTEAIGTALRMLPAEQRQAVEMAYFGGLSQSEIAESTGLALGTVKTRMRLGMQKLRDYLAPVNEARV